MNKLRISKLILAGLLLLSLIGANLVGEAQQDQDVLGSVHAVLVIAEAVTKFDLLLLTNGGLANGTILEKQFTIKLENGQTQTVSKQEIRTLALATNGRINDRIVKKSGKILQGDLQIETFRIHLATGQELNLDRSKIRGAIMQIPVEGRLGDTLEKGKMVSVIKKLVNNPLMPEMVYSLTKYDWIWLANLGLLSGNVSDKEFTFQTREGNKKTLDRSDISILLFTPRLTLVVLKQGDYVAGTLKPSEIHLKPAYQASSTKFAGEKIRAILFQVPSLSFGGGG